MRKLLVLGDTYLAVILHYITLCDVTIKIRLQETWIAD